MVAETKERMTKMFDAMSEGFRAQMDAGRKVQQACIDTFTQVGKERTNFEGFFPMPERINQDWMPFMTRNMQTVVECFDTNVRAGVDAMRTACNQAKAEETDPYKRTRAMWDAAFDAYRTGFDAMTKATQATIDNWTNFCNTTCCGESATKSTPKSSK